MITTTDLRAAIRNAATIANSVGRAPTITITAADDSRGRFQIEPVHGHYRQARLISLLRNLGLQDLHVVPRSLADGDDLPIVAGEYNLATVTYRTNPFRPVR